MTKNVQNLLNIIKYTPPIIIMLICIFIIFLMYQEQEQDFKKEKLFFETEYIKTEKDKLYSNINTIHNYIKNEKERENEELKKDLTRNINMVHKIATNIYIKNKNTHSKNEIIKQIKDAIESIRFNKGLGYFSIHTMEGINILQPIIRVYEGTSVLNRKDIKGTYSVKKAIKIAKTKGEGFLNWYSYKPNDKSKEFKKIGIVKKFEAYNLIITTGIFTEDYDENLRNRILTYLSKLKFEKEGFLSVINYEGKILLPQSKEILNDNLFEEKELTYYKKFFKNLILKEGRDIGTFISLKSKVMEKKDTTEAKTIFSKRFDDWKWIISASFKLSDANRIIEKRKVILEEKYNNYKIEVLLYGVLFTLILLIISFFIAKLIEQKFLDYKESLENQILENVSQKETLLQAQKIANIATWKLDLKTNKAIWSNEFTHMFGLSEENKDKFGPEYIETLMFKEDIPSFHDSMKNCILTEEEHDCMYRINRPDGEIIWINCRGQINKEKSFVVGTVQDITSTKKLELEKQEKEELLYRQSKMAAMGEMIGNIAHQWRQPLSTITTAATGARLQKEMDCLSDSQLNSSLIAINNSAQYLSQTIDDFRDFFNPKNSVQNEFKIEDTLIKTLKLIDSQFNAKEIEIIKNITNYELLSVENNIIQVLINILNNARDALITREKVRKLILINIYQKDNTAYIEIIDNAGGVSDDVIDRIFEPYFTTKHKSQGTGIGLYMSEEIVKNHLNGTITVENTFYSYDNIEYKGAKFIISIPKK